MLGDVDVEGHFNVVQTPSDLAELCMRENCKSN